MLAATHAQSAVPSSGALRLRGDGYETNTRLSGESAVRLGESAEVRLRRDEDPFPRRIALAEQTRQAAIDKAQISIADGADEREESGTTRRPLALRAERATRWSVVTRPDLIPLIVREREHPLPQASHVVRCERPPEAESVIAVGPGPPDGGIAPDR